MSTVAERLFYGSIECRVPEFAFHTKESLNNEGRLYHIQPEMEKEFLSSYRKVYLSPVKIMEFYERGANPIICSPDRIMQIYEDILEHLQNWLTVLQTQILSPSRVPPITDFDSWNAFAKWLHPYTVYCRQYATARPDAFETKHLDAVIGNSMSILFGNIEFSNRYNGLEPFVSSYEALVDRYAQVVK